jgi:hypothetical protein
MGHKGRRQGNSIWAEERMGSRRIFFDLIPLERGWTDG